LDGVDAFRMQADGSFRSPAGAAVAWDDVDAEVGWPTADLFDTGGPLGPMFAFLGQSKHLRWVQSVAAGFEHPLFRSLVERDVRLTLSHVTAQPIAEWVLRSVLEHYQQPEKWRANADQQGWVRHDFREVLGTTWLVIGFGHIGQETAVRARAFGGRVVGVRRRERGDEPADVVVTPDAVAAWLPESDVVVLSAPASAATQRLVDTAFLEAMKPGSILVNVARGSLVDQEALLAALDRGRPEAAILDVTDPEPLPPGHPLWLHPRVTVTPHNSAGGLGRYPRHAELFVENLARYRAGQPLLHEVTIDDFG
jgi:phosphoglycerate dehydrogenase-like enzyme